MRKSGIQHWRTPATAILAVACLFASLALAQDDEEGEEKEAPAHTRQGADTCLGCHDDEGEFPVLSIMETPHAVVADERTPFGGAECEACHGPGGEHGKRLRFGEDRPPVVGFGDNSLWSRERENAVCQDCHEEQGHTAWDGGVHERADLACVDCHTLHEKSDPVTVTADQPEVCYSCHVEQRAQAHRARAHPLRQGKMECADCHEPHGSLTEAMLKEPTVNDTCYQCHAEKRGPFLWEHAPASEDCTTCHQPHGSNHPGMLTQRAPLLCQQCHSRLGHPSIGRTGNELPSGSPSAFQLSGSCMNCHSQVHGSNHPSGANLSR